MELKLSDGIACASSKPDVRFVRTSGVSDADRFAVMVILSALVFGSVLAELMLPVDVIVAATPYSSSVSSYIESRSLP